MMTFKQNYLVLPAFILPIGLSCRPVSFPQDMMQNDPMKPDTMGTGSAE